LWFGAHTLSQSPRQEFMSANRLFVALPETVQQRLLGSCRVVELEFAQILAQPGQAARYAYFPLDSLISVVTTLEGGARLEVGIVGDEGMLGTGIVLGVSKWPQHAVVQGAGSALRMASAVLVNHCKQEEAVRRRLHRYIHVLMAQLAQTAACTHFHRVEARLARWLLMTRDRAHSNKFHLTHEFMAYMLGVRRVGVTHAAISLQERGLIQYSRGEIAIVDNKGLERASCGCYAQARQLYDETLGVDAPGRGA
jgi:CRP-like cAMP-binding protein